MKTVFRTWKNMFAVINRRPGVMIPFMILGIINLAVLVLLYYYPQKPLAAVLAPPISVLFGEKFLHYPYNFYILAKIYNYAEIAVSALAGMLMTATSVGMVLSAQDGGRVSFLANFIRAFKRYFALIFIWGITFAIITAVGKFGLKPLAAQIGGLKFLAVYFVGTVLINMLFIYAVPSLIVKGRSLIAALGEALVTLRNFFFPTLFLVGVPSLLYLPVIVIKRKSAALMEAFSPEVIALVLLAGIIATLVIDLLITVSVTILFINKESKNDYSD